MATSGGGGASSAGVLQAAGVLLQGIGSYYARRSQRFGLQSRAIESDYASSTAALNARAASLDAEFLARQGQQQRAQVTAQYGQQISRQRASVGASGVVSGSGSSAEVLASQELAKQQDAITIDLNTLRAVRNAQSQAVDYRNQAALEAVQAQNYRRSARAINPLLGAATSFIGGATQIAPQWYN